MARDAHSLLIASKKPQHRELLDRLDTLTEDEICNLKTNPWVIKGLIQEKQFRTRTDALSRATQIADLMMSKTS